MLAVLGFVAALVVLVVRSLLIDEIKGRLQRRITANVEATIAALPPQLQAEWGEEWRAELAAIITMPVTAARFAYALRRDARQLVADSAYAPAEIDHHSTAPMLFMPQSLPAVMVWEMIRDDERRAALEPNDEDVPSSGGSTSSVPPAPSSSAPPSASSSSAA